MVGLDSQPHGYAEFLTNYSSDDILRAASALARTMKKNKYQIDNGKSAFSTAFQSTCIRREPCFLNT